MMLQTVIGNNSPLDRLRQRRGASVKPDARQKAGRKRVKATARVRGLSPRMCVVSVGEASCEAAQGVIARPEGTEATAETWEAFVTQLVKVLGTNS